MSRNSRIIAKPSIPAQQGNEAAIERFINSAPDARASSPVDAPVAPTPVSQELAKGQGRSRKTAISLTLPDQVIEAMDRKRAELGGLSRPAFIALAVSKFEG
ncbi:ribbon-helix-helix domain-containing protein [Massilia sp. IC2-477]|uniref:ribbon-helix-helix domain-containing protein n=1 Tax=Massilia sp. IC2-477 TaxID=2887198 RepID=UPI001D128DB6|nr:ribbon-helix-helix domain-containing protein [Massilia sp. IC2-477]MCC2958782.1 ribbon-helix-helix domain-containing protein [Massilia sp. IC2-477]